MASKSFNPKEPVPFVLNNGHLDNYSPNEKKSIFRLIHTIDSNTKRSEPYQPDDGLRRALDGSSGNLSKKNYVSSSRRPAPEQQPFITFTNKPSKVLSPSFINAYSTWASNASTDSGILRNQKDMKGRPYKFRSSAVTESSNSGYKFDRDLDTEFAKRLDELDGGSSTFRASRIYGVENKGRVASSVKKLNGQSYSSHEARSSSKPSNEYASESRRGEFRQVKPVFYPRTESFSNRTTSAFEKQQSLREEPDQSEATISASSIRYNSDARNDMISSLRNSPKSIPDLQNDENSEGSIVDQMASFIDELKDFIDDRLIDTTIQLELANERISSLNQNINFLTNEFLLLKRHNENLKQDLQAGASGGDDSLAANAANNNNNRLSRQTFYKKEIKTALQPFSTPAVCDRNNSSNKGCSANTRFGRQNLFNQRLSETRSSLVSSSSSSTLSTSQSSLVSSVNKSLPTISSSASSVSSPKKSAHQSTTRKRLDPPPLPKSLASTSSAKAHNESENSASSRGSGKKSHKLVSMNSWQIHHNAPNSPKVHAIETTKLNYPHQKKNKKNTSASTLQAEKNKSATSSSTSNHQHNGHHHQSSGDKRRKENYSFTKLSTASTSSSGSLDTYDNLPLMGKFDRSNQEENNKYHNDYFAGYGKDELLKKNYLLSKYHEDELAATAAAVGKKAAVAKLDSYYEYDSANFDDLQYSNSNENCIYERLSADERDYEENVDDYTDARLVHHLHASIISNSNNLVKDFDTNYSWDYNDLAAKANVDKQSLTHHHKILDEIF